MRLPLVSSSTYGRVLPIVVIATACGSSGPTVPAGPDGLGVLFIGNSLTFENDMPGILRALLDSIGFEARVEEVTAGGFGLEDHWLFGPARETIARGGWDVVIVQQGPSATEGRPSLLEFSRRFALAADSVGARLGLYMVWPLQNRPFDWPRVSESYRMAAEATDGLLFPVGEAWRATWRRDQEIELYGGDGLHPLPAASYLAALVFFEQLTGRSPVGLSATIDFELPFTPDIDLSLDVARTLQEAAREANADHARR